MYVYIWSNYSNLTRPHPKWWFSKGNPLISGKSRLVKYYDWPRYIIYLYRDMCSIDTVAIVSKLIALFCIASSTNHFLVLSTACMDFSRRLGSQNPRVSCRQTEHGYDGYDIILPRTLALNMDSHKWYQMVTICNDHPSE